VTLRLRLTVWYTLILSATLLVCGGILLYEEPRLARAALDAELTRESMAVEGVLREELGEGLKPADAVDELLREIRLPGRGVAIFTQRGDRIKARWQGMEPVDQGAVLAASGLGVLSAGTKHGDALFYARQVAHEQGPFVIVVSASLADLERDLSVLRRALLIAGACGIVLAALGGVLLAARALRPLQVMAREAAEITESDSSKRLTLPRSRDELRALGRTFNSVLDRLNGVLLRQRAFMADASHELRTPVSVVRSAAEVTLAREPRTEAEYRDALKIVSEQTGRLGRMVEDMFLLARVDAGRRPLLEGQFYLDELIDECVRGIRMLADPRRVGLMLTCPSEVEMRGDEDLVRQMLVNLLENALRHTDDGGQVAVSCVTDRDAIRIQVTDSGEGIPVGDHERVFERFVKLDAARGAGSGAGLGLPIARWIAEAHGGTLTVLRSDGSGTTFEAVLPLNRIESAGPEFVDHETADETQPAVASAREYSHQPVTRVRA
jgi:heavy metal sensor kinase